MIKWDELSPRERDALVAEKVMGWVLGNNPLTSMIDTGWIDPVTGSWAKGFSPSADITDAWQVVEKLQEVYLYTDIRTCADFYEVWITDHANDSTTGTFATPKLPEAICFASLKAMGVEIEVKRGGGENNG
jgi:hypothetical protein